MYRRAASASATVIATGMKLWNRSSILDSVAQPFWQCCRLGDLHRMCTGTCETRSSAVGEVIKTICRIAGLFIPIARTAYREAA